jgi:hypothetical protein
VGCTIPLPEACREVRWLHPDCPRPSSNTCKHPPAPLTRVILPHILKKYFNFFECSVKSVYTIKKTPRKKFKS